MSNVRLLRSREGTSWFRLGSYGRRCEAVALLLLPIPVGYLIVRLLWRMFWPGTYDEFFCVMYALPWIWAVVTVPGLRNGAVDWLAYGYAEDEGIYFRKWFCRRFVKWKSIERLDCWPEFGGRIELNLYSQPWPVVFIPEAVRGEKGAKVPQLKPGTLDFLSRKLEEARPGKSAFVLCYQAPEKKLDLPFLRRDLDPWWGGVAISASMIIFSPS